MSARYLWIKDLNAPYDLGVDEAGRTKRQFNIVAERVHGTSEFEDDIATILVAANPAMFVLTGTSRNIFTGTTAKIPPGKGPYLSIIITGGLAGGRQQNRGGVSFERPTALIVARATDQVAAIAMARAAYDALTVVVNQTVP